MYSSILLCFAIISYQESYDLLFRSLMISYLGVL